ncbi:MAG: tRNA-uridine aminocarboxypropyltransferase [Rhodoferax sp.]
MKHAVARLREERLASLASLGKPFVPRGSHAPRCPDCRVLFSHCLCTLRPQLTTRAGVCLIMGDMEPLKPSNTGWLIADVVQDTAAFGWSRTQVDPALLALLADPHWAPCLVFPGEYVAPERVVTEVPVFPGKRPLFVLLDATWSEARKMFRKSPYLNHLPVLSLQPEQLSRYRLRRSTRDEHLCTSEVAALCLTLGGEPLAAETLETYLEVFSNHYLNSRQSVPPDLEDAAHQRLRVLAGSAAMG